MLPLRDSQQSAKVLCCKRDGDGNLIGCSLSNPYLDRSLYKVEFSDGHVEAYATTLIAENIYKQLDDEGNKYRLIVEIIDHEKDITTLSRAESTVIVNDRSHPRRTTKGWRLCVQWCDGTTRWECLKDLKESNPVEVADYATTHGLQEKWSSSGRCHLPYIEGRNF